MKARITSLPLALNSMNTPLDAAKSTAEMIAHCLGRCLQIGTALWIGAGVLPGTTPFVRAACQQGCDNVNQNTFFGEEALVNNTTGPGDTAVGFEALLNNTTGQANTAMGLEALMSNIDGFG